MAKIKQIIFLALVLILVIPQTGLGLTVREILQGHDNLLGQVLGASTLALDVSTPAAVKGNFQTLTTASFTPPAGSVLYVLVGINSNYSNKINSISGGGLTFTKVASYGTELGSDSIAYLYTASVSSSQAMTVSAVQQASSGGTYAFLKVLVITGANSTSPVGAVGGARGVTGTINNTYTASSDNSWGWMLTSDWAQKGIPTVGSGQSVYDSYNISGEDTYAIIQRSTPTATAGTSVTLNTAAPTSGAQISQLYFEMVPAQTGAPPTADTTAPAIPTNLSATAISSSAINLSWTASTDNTAVTGYKIYRNGSQVSTVMGQLSFSDTGLTASTAYSYTVSAYDSANNNSAQSASAGASTQAAPAGNTISANSCSQTDVQNAINSVSNGGTVNVPGGTCTWTSNISTPNTKGLTLNGGGATITGKIDLNLNSSVSSRITAFNFVTPIRTQYQANDIAVSGSKTTAPFRLDHNTFTSTQGGSVLLDIGGNPPGLIDNNSFNAPSNSEMIHNNGTGAGDASGWSDDVAPGGTDMVYLENNTFTNNDSSLATANPAYFWGNSAIQNYYGARMVFRYNTMSMSHVDVHGTAGNVGGRWWEIYQNTFYIVPNGDQDKSVGIRAGSGVIFNNHKTGRTNYKGDIVLYEEDSGYPALYQVGRGKNQTLDPAYVWGNDSSINVSSGSSNVVASRDYYLSAKPGYTSFIYPYPLTAAGMPNPGGGPTPPSDTTAPTTPTSLSATAVSSSQINLTWPASTDNVGVTGYDVYRAGTLLTTVTGTSYSNTGLSASTVYSYTVRAKDAAGNNSSQSLSVFAATQAPPLTPDTTAPTVSLTAPSSGTVSGNITFSATASDPAAAGQTTSGLKALTLYIDGTVYATSSLGNISKILDTTALTNTSHTLTAQGTDNAGNNSTIATVAITVNNAPAAKYPRTITLTSLEGLSTIPNNQSITVTVLSGSTVLETQTLTPNASKQYTVTFLSSDPQVVNIRVKANGYLSRLLASIDITQNTGAVFSIPQLLAGDLNDDNTINTLDYSALNSHWNQNYPTGDINKDGLVNSIDFAILKNNWNKVGE